MEQDKLYFLRKSLVVLILILFLALVGIMLISTQVKTISLNYYGTNQTVITLADSVDSFLIQNKIYVEDDSNISPSVESKIENGMNIDITSKTESAKIDLQSMKDNLQKITAKVEEVTEIIQSARDENNVINISSIENLKLKELKSLLEIILREKKLGFDSSIDDNEKKNSYDDKPYTLNMKI